MAHFYTYKNEIKTGWTKIFRWQATFFLILFIYNNILFKNCIKESITCYKIVFISPEIYVLVFNFIPLQEFSHLQCIIYLFTFMCNYYFAGNSLFCYFSQKYLLGWRKVAFLTTVVWKTLRPPIEKSYLMKFHSNNLI